MELPPALPMLPALDVQRIKDAENLRMLSIGYYIVGGFTALFSSLGLIHLTIGLLIIGGAFPNPPVRPPHAPHYRQRAAVAPPDAAAPDGDEDAVPTPQPSPKPFSPAGEARRSTEPFSPDQDNRRQDEAPFLRAIGFLFVILGGGIVLIGWTVGGLTAYAGRCLQRRQHRLLTFIMAGINCLHVPFGTALGVCTFLVLQRPTVEALYQPPAPGQPPA